MWGDILTHIGMHHTHQRQICPRKKYLPTWIHQTFLVSCLFRMRIWICMSNLLRVKRGVCPACQLLAKTTTMGNCLHLHAPLVLTRTSISQRPKKSVPANGIMSALIALENTFFFPQGCFIVDTTMTNPTQFSYKRNYSVPQPSTPMSYDSHDPWWKAKAKMLLEDI